MMFAGRTIFHINHWFCYRNIHLTFRKYPIRFYRSVLVIYYMIRICVREARVAVYSKTSLSQHIHPCVTYCVTSSTKLRLFEGQIVDASKIIVVWYFTRMGIYRKQCFRFLCSVNYKYYHRRVETTDPGRHCLFFQPKNSSRMTSHIKTVYLLTCGSWKQNGSRPSRECFSRNFPYHCRSTPGNHLNWYFTKGKRRSVWGKTNQSLKCFEDFWTSIFQIVEQLYFWTKL